MKETLTWPEAVKMHQTYLRARRRAAKTLAWYSEQLRAFDVWRQTHGRGDNLPAADELDAYIADQHAADLRPATVHARFRSIRSVFNFLERRRKIAPSDNAIKLLDAPSVPREARRAPSVAQMDALLACIDADTHWLARRDRLIILLLGYSGLRVGEVCGLCAGDIDEVDCSVLVRRGKGEKARRVPCPVDTIHALREYMQARPGGDAERLFVACDGRASSAGAPLTTEGVRQMLIRRCRRAGMGYYSPHAFRHAFAMWLLNGGARLTTVSAAMGHSDPSTTARVYAHTTIETVRREYQEALARLK